MCTGKHLFCHMALFPQLSYGSVREWAYQLVLIKSLVQVLVRRTQIFLEFPQDKIEIIRFLCLNLFLQKLSFRRMLSWKQSLMEKNLNTLCYRCSVLCFMIVTWEKNHCSQVTSMCSCFNDTSRYSSMEYFMFSCSVAYKVSSFVHLHPWLVFVRLCVYLNFIYRSGLWGKWGLLQKSLLPTILYWQDKGC